MCKNPHVTIKGYCKNSVTCEKPKSQHILFIYLFIWQEQILAFFGLLVKETDFYRNVEKPTSNGGPWQETASI